MPDEYAPTNHEVREAAKKLTAQHVAAIRARMRTAPMVRDSEGERNSTGRTATSPDAVLREVVETNEDNMPAFPSATVAAAMRAADVVLPQKLEQRVLMICGMYMSGSTPTEIATELNIAPTLVKAEIRKLDAARGIAYKEDPALAVKTVEMTLDVVQTTVHAMGEAAQLMTALKGELMSEHDEFVSASQSGDLWKDDEEPEDEGLTFKKGKPTKRKRYGMYSMKVDSYTKLLEVWGKQVDRVANVMGLLNKNIPQGAGLNINQTNITINDDKLHAFADMFLTGTGNSIAQLKPATSAEVIDGEVLNDPS